MLVSALDATEIGSTGARLARNEKAHVGELRLRLLRLGGAEAQRHEGTRRRYIYFHIELLRTPHLTCTGARECATDEAAAPSNRSGLRLEGQFSPQLQAEPF
jgi:hypothetical protein